MFIHYEGRGILAPVFLIFSFLGTSFIVMGIPEFFFDYRVQDLFDFRIVAGLSLLCSGFLTTRYGTNYYKNAAGEKIKMDIKNTIYFVPMKYIGMIETGLGIAAILDGLYETYLMHA